MKHGREAPLESESKRARIRGGSSISNAELMAMLRSSSTPISSKLDQTFQYVQGYKNGVVSTGSGAVPMQHFISFLADWVQSVIISASKESSSTDSRSWQILEWCLSGETNVHVYPGLLKGLEIVLKSTSTEVLGLGVRVLELLQGVYDRTFRPQLHDWMSLVGLSFDLVLQRKAVTSNGESLLVQATTLAAEGLAKFLRTLGNSKGAFQSTVEKLLDSALEILRTVGSCSSQDAPAMSRLERAVSSVLENGLFHTILLEGFPDVCTASARWLELQERGTEAASNHKLLFEKVKQLQQQKRFVALRSLGALLKLFVQRFRIQRAAVSEDVFGVQGSGQRHDTEIVKSQPEGDESKKLPLTDNQQQFLVFVELALPLIQELNQESKSKDMTERKGLLAAVIGLLQAASDERIYIPTKDIPSQGHFKFIKLYCHTITSYAKMLCPDDKNSSVEYRDIITGIRIVLDMDHRAADGRFQDLWLILLSASVAFEGCVGEFVSTGCQMLSIMSELRNVGSLPAVFASLRNGPVAMGMKTLFCNALFLRSMGRTIETLPEAQASEVVSMVSKDVFETLGMKEATEAVVLGVSELYAHILENLNVTSSNASQVGAQVRQMVESVVAEPLGKLLDKLQSSGKFGKSRRLRLLLLLRLYLSSRTVYRQCVSLMSSPKAKKAIAAAHMLDIESSDFDWMQVTAESQDLGFFSWIGTPPSTTVYEVMSKLIMEAGDSVFPPLRYVLHSMVIQRLNDLHRYIRSAKYFEKKFLASCSEDPALQLEFNEDALDGSAAASRDISKLVASLEEEGKGLVHMFLEDSGQFSLQQMSKDSLSNNLEPEVWNGVVATLTEKTFYSAKWTLLMRTMDLWSSFSKKKHIKKFLTCAVRRPDEAYEVLNSLLFYENQLFQDFLLPAVWELLKELLGLDTKLKTLKKLSKTKDWMRVLESECSVPCLDSIPLASLEKSISLIQMVSSFSWERKHETLYTCCMFYVERISLKLLIGSEVEYGVKFLELFAACRRALQSFSIGCKEASPAIDSSLCQWLYSSIDIASENLTKTSTYIEGGRTSMASVLKSTESIMGVKLRAIFARDWMGLLSSHSSGSPSDDESVSICMQQASEVIEGTSGWSPFVRFQTASEVGRIYKLLSSASLIRCISSSVAGCIEGLDKRCQENKDKQLLWRPVPTSWISSLQQVEQSVGTLLLERFAGLSDLDASNNGILDLFQETPVNDTAVEEEENENVEQDHSDADSMSAASNTETLNEADIDDMDVEESVRRADDLHHLLTLSASQQTTLARFVSCEMEREQSELVGDLFMTLGALIKLRSLHFSPFALKRSSVRKEAPVAVSALLRVLYSLLSEAASQETFSADKQATSFWLFGAVKCMESIGLLLPSLEPSVPAAVYLKLVTMHIDLLAAVLWWQSSSSAVRECSQDSRTFKVDNGSFCSDLKISITDSFGALLKYAPRHHLLVALHTIQKAFSGGFEVFKLGCPLRFGDCDDGKVAVVVAAGVECLAISLDKLSGPWRLKAFASYSPTLLAGLHSLISHLQGPGLFLEDKRAEGKKTSSLPVLLQVLDIINRVASREAVFPLKPSHVALALHAPANVFKPLYQLRSPSSRRQKYSLVLDLFVTSCKLLCAFLRHRKRESGRTMALLGESLRVLLYCLESSSNKVSSGSPSLPLNSAVQCAQWLRRVYEELGEHKQTLSRYCLHVLSDYLSVLSGAGPSGAGLDREIDRELRPGVYALLCSSTDLQQLHSALGEGALRTNLVMIRQEYDKSFKYTGKV